mgnify:CR=1 FL=1
MSRIAYVNGSYIAHNSASVHIEERGFQFADSVYEVVYVYKSKLIDQKRHLDRLDHSLNELMIEWPVKRSALEIIIKQIIKKNLIKTGLVYLQVSRGSSPRDFPFPKGVKPTLVVTARPLKPFNPENALKGMEVTTLPDIRWERCDIKTTQLLPAAISKQKALDSGVSDAWFVNEDNIVTEGTSNNAWIVTQDNKLKTRPASHAILNGITRQAILELAHLENIDVSEEAFSLEEALNAKEAFVSSASACVKPVTKINDHVIGDGQVGEITRKIAQYYVGFLEKQ